LLGLISSSAFVVCVQRRFLADCMMREISFGNVNQFIFFKNLNIFIFLKDLFFYILDCFNLFNLLMSKIIFKK
jgi:hypothetical protein